MYQRNLVPVDGSTTSSNGPDDAIQLAKLTGGSLRLIQAVDILSFATGFEPDSVRAGDLVPRMREVGGQVLTEAKVRVAAQPQALSRHPVRMIQVAAVRATTKNTSVIEKLMATGISALPKKLQRKPLIR